MWCSGAATGGKVRGGSFLNILPHFIIGGLFDIGLEIKRKTSIILALTICHVQSYC